MIIALTCLIAIAVIAFVLTVRPQDLPDVEPPSPFRHLDERKASIYENLRDLQFATEFFTDLAVSALG